MLPSPFYAEVPADLGDDRTWVDEAAGHHHRNEFTQRSRTGLRALAGAEVAAVALMLVSRVRSAFAL